MPSECKKCGSKDNYNFALNIGLCNSCILAELEQLQAENKQLEAYRDYVQQKINKEEMPWQYHIWEQYLKGNTETA